LLRLPSLVPSFAEKKKTTTVPTVAFFFAFLCGGVTVKKATITFFLYEKNKKMLIAFVAFFDGFTAKKEGMATIVAFLGGFVVKKVKVAMSSPSSMMVVLYRGRW